MFIIVAYTKRDWLKRSDVGHPMLILFMSGNALKQHRMGQNQPLIKHHKVINAEEPVLASCKCQAMI